MAAGDLTISGTHSGGDYTVITGTVAVDTSDRDFAIGPTTSHLLYFNTGVTDNSGTDVAEDATRAAIQMNYNVANAVTGGNVSIKAAAAHTWVFEAGIIGTI
jgi:hypothetical protein